MSDDHNRIVQQYGEGIVSKICSENNMLFRFIREHDKGIDGEIELKDSNGNNKFIGVQIKTRSRFCLDKNAKMIINVTNENIKYWNDSGRPVILILCKYKTEEIYWGRVDGVSRSKIELDKVNRFNDDKIYKKLERLINSYRKKTTLSTPIKDISSILEEFFVDVKDIVEPMEDKIKEIIEYINKENYEMGSNCLQHLRYLYNYDYFKILHARCLYGLNKLEDCINLTSEVEKNNKYLMDVYELLSISYMDLMKYELSKKYITKGLELCDSLTFYNLNGLYEYRNGNDEVAYNIYKGIEKNNDFRRELNAGFYFNLALFSTGLVKCDEAIEYYKICIKLNPKFYDAYNNMALLLKGLWRLDEAIIFFQKAIEVEPNNYYAYFNLGYLLKDLEQNYIALEYYLKGSEYAKGCMPYSVYFDIGSLYTRLNKLDEASEAFTKGYRIQGVAFKKDKPLSIIIDIGYEVSNGIVLEYNNEIETVSVKDTFKLQSLFDGIPLYRKWRQYAEINDITYPLEKEHIKRLVDKDERVKSKK